MMPVRWKFPAALRAIVQRLPEGPPARLVALALNAALCAGLLSRAALEPLAGKSLCLEASDAGARVRLEYGAQGFRVYSRSGITDVTISAALADLAALALRREDPDTLFFTRRLVITGDTELGLVAKNALDAVDWSKLAPLRGPRA
jgi:predicted lipid carrier protein YhbT